jgi:predicted  nucleic acid-binding Zn-ribbon protein
MSEEKQGLIYDIQDTLDEMDRIRKKFEAKYEPIFDPDKEFDLQRDLRVEREKREAIRKAAEDAGDAINPKRIKDADGQPEEVIDLWNDAPVLMTEGEDIEQYDLCGRLKNS